MEELLILQVEQNMQLLITDQLKVIFKVEIN